MKPSARHAITPSDPGLELPPGPNWRYTPSHQNQDGTVEIDAMQLVWVNQFYAASPHINPNPGKSK